MRFKKFVLSALSTLTLALVLPATVYAHSLRVIPVSGSFNINKTTCPNYSSPECTSGQMKGDIKGLNQLIQKKLVLFPDPEVGPYGRYVDFSRIDSQYGRFEGNENGLAHAESETLATFNSITQFTSTDGCGSTLFLYNKGTINLLDDTSAGTYTGILTLRSC